MSTADELAKLDALRIRGVLSEAEFNAEKGRLLEAPTPVPPVAQIQSTAGNQAPGPVTEVHHSNTSLIVVIVIVVVVGIGIGAFFLLKGSAARSQTEGNTAAESNLQTAFTGAKTYFEEANQTYAGVLNSTTYSNITQVDTGLSFIQGTTASTASNVISVQSEVGGNAVVLTSYASPSGICFGILDITAALNAPLFPAYPQTAAVGTYFFADQQSNPGNCEASITYPGLLSSNGW